jgi:DNA-binding response OmpR family regulator
MKLLYHTNPAHPYEFDPEKFKVTVCTSIPDALRKAIAQPFDCIVLHVSANDNGFELINWLNNKNRQDGIIALIDAESSHEIVHYFNSGVDDCVQLPINNNELEARINAIVRRKKFNTRNKLYFANIVIDFNQREVFVWEKKIALTKTEYEILLLLIANKNEIVSKEKIITEIWDAFPKSMQSYDFLFAHLKNLKTKLKNARAEIVIKNNYGVGYLIEENLY